MIVPMEKVRFLGPYADLDRLLAVLQDAGVVQLSADGDEEGVERTRLSPRQHRLRRQLESIVEDVEAVLGRLDELPGDRGRPLPLPRCARLAHRLRRRLDERLRRHRELEETRDRLVRSREILAAFTPFLDVDASGMLRAHLILLRAGGDEEIERVERHLDRFSEGRFELQHRTLPGGEVALLVMVPKSVSRRIDALWQETGIEEIEIAGTKDSDSLAAAAGGVEDALERTRAELAEIEDALAELASEHGADLVASRRDLHDRLASLEALALARRTRHAFVLEGWVPARGLARVRERIDDVFAGRVAVEALERQEWHGDETPVILSNPPIFRPFEALVRPLPLPRYGSLDPTPFVAVFFPMFFGLILGDVGYGLLLGLAGAVLAGFAPGPGLRRDVGRIALSCALFTVIFGFLYGELFGDLGRRWLGMEPILFDRGEAVLPFLALTLALGFAHLLLGLVVGAVAAWTGDRRRALGRGLAALMVLGSGAALLVVGGVLPRGFFTPLVVALLVLFALLVAAEGIVAPVELLSTLGHVLSYARIMAIGTASVMLAVVANRMVGALGSVVVGTLFALLFHLINFALGVFSPAIHSLRLHYVEFFGTFYSPGGVPYRPFTHWRGGNAEVGN